MVLIRKLIFKCMTENVMVFVQYLESEKNKFADAISRDKISYFKQLAAEDGIEVDQQPTDIPTEIWPISKVWLK